MADYMDMAIAGYQAIGQATQAALSYGTHRADRKFNAEQAQIQRDWQLSMWNKANEYNSPRQQMERLRQAGLNPNLVYGDGATTLAAHIGNAASASAPSDNIRYPDLGLAVMAGLQARKTESDINLQESMELKNREEAKSISKSREGIEIENMFKRDSYQLRLDQLTAENNLKTELANSELVKRNQIVEEIENLAKLRDVYDAQIANENKITQAKVDQIKADIENARKTTASLVGKMDAEARKANADAWLAHAEGVIKNDPRYQNSVIQKAVSDAYKSLIDGKVETVEYNLRVLDELTRPEYGTAAFEWTKWWDNWVGAPAAAVGKVFGGNVGISKKL